MLTGYSEDELMALTDPGQLIHPDSRADVAARREARERGEEGENQYELKILRKDGSERWVDITVARIEYIDGPALLVNGVDIHQRKTAALEHRKMEERLHLAQRVGRSIVWEWDPRSDILTCSTLAEDLGGPGLADHLVSGTSFQGLVHPYD